MSGWFSRLIVLFLLSCTLGFSLPPGPESWTPIRWTGGPLELAWRSHAHSLPGDAAVRDALARWYDPATLNLLDDSPANCLLVSFSAPVDISVETAQQQMIKLYAQAAHKRGLAVLGLVYAAGDPSEIAAKADHASLDGLVLDGDFAAEFTATLRKAAGSMLVIEIANVAAATRWKPARIAAVEGVAPGGRNLTEMGIRGTPSSEPWIESNIWLARSFAFVSTPRPIWISSQMANPSAIAYERAVADAAAGSAHWIVSLDDALRARLLGHDASALDTWHRLSTYLKFAESHVAGPALVPYGTVGIVVDPTKNDLADEYLKLIARRQVAYRLVNRSDLSAAGITKFHALVATELEPPSASERKLLLDFAENGGIILAGPSWGRAPNATPFVEVPTGKGRVIVYQDPDPESVARDLKELLSDEDLGVVPFNVPSVITAVSGGSPGQPLVVQLVNYFDRPVEAITLRIAGNYISARLETPEGMVQDLPLHNDGRKTEVAIPKLLLWGAVSMH